MSLISDRAVFPQRPGEEWIKKIWEVDPLECPKCASEMKIVSFITEDEVIRKILENVDLRPNKSTAAERAPPSAILPTTNLSLSQV
jgi:hypothetical protein